VSEAIIVGGGIGGLSTAAALARVGFECQVFEQSEALREVGAGLTIWGNAVRVLRQFGLEEDLSRLGSRLDSMEVRSSDGRILSKADFALLAKKLGVPVPFVVHRADLLRELARLTNSTQVHCSYRCVRLVEGADGVTASFADKGDFHADFVVGADGLHSTVRRHLHGDVRPRFAGYTCWRAVIPFESEVLHNSGFETWGAGARFAALPCGPGRVCWWATRNAKEGERDALCGRKAAVQEIFQQWHSPIPELIAATARECILRNDIADRLPSTEWGKGRITLLGDAAHPTTPNLGQGACQAMEDALVLADCLRHISGVEPALREYERRRFRRTAAITTQSWHMGRICQWERPAGCWMRNLATRCTPSWISQRVIQSIMAYEPPVLPPASLRV